MNRRLFHFPSSPFARRVRLALAHKELSCELVDARADPEMRKEARRLAAIPTIPVLVEPNGHALGDTTAIARYLDAAYADKPAIFPAGAESAHAMLEATALVDLALNTVVDLGTRYFALRNDPAWAGVLHEMLGRAQDALDVLADRAASRAGKTWTDAGWSAADMWLTTAVQWIEGWPGRAKENANIAQIVTLGLRLPAGLSRWTDAHRARKDFTALG
jgi:glutathione S-transferase